MLKLVSALLALALTAGVAFGEESSPRTGEILRAFAVELPLVRTIGLRNEWCPECTLNAMGYRQTISTLGLPFGLFWGSTIKRYRNEEGHQLSLATIAWAFDAHVPAWEFIILTDKNNRHDARLAEALLARALPDKNRVTETISPLRQKNGWEFGKRGTAEVVRFTVFMKDPRAFSHHLCKHCNPGGMFDRMVSGKTPTPERPWCEGCIPGAPLERYAFAGQIPTRVTKGRIHTGIFLSTEHLHIITYQLAWDRDTPEKDKRVPVTVTLTGNKDIEPMAKLLQRILPND